MSIGDEQQDVFVDYKTQIQYTKSLLDRGKLRCLDDRKKVLSNQQIEDLLVYTSTTRNPERNRVIVLLSGIVLFLITAFFVNLLSAAKKTQQSLSRGGNTASRKRPPRDVFCDQSRVETIILGQDTAGASELTKLVRVDA